MAVEALHRLVSRSFLKELQPRTRWLLGLWVFFLLLVLFKVHGSSISRSATFWKPEIWYAGYSDYLLEPVDKLVRKVAGDRTGELPRLLGSMPQTVRQDEWMGATPWALAQCSHVPRFPVINTSIGLGQNMLLLHSAPVWHVAALARPATWGYLLLGAERGLAWQWWFQVFGCFTALYLLFEVFLAGHRGLAAFGAFWFCGSACIVCWSLWPAHVTFFPALGCVAAYHLLRSAKPGIQLLCGVLLGLSVAGFVMFLYPPWQVPLGYVFLFIFFALFIRDKLHLSIRNLSRHQLLACGLAIVIAAGILLPFFMSCAPALQALAHTVYPGKGQCFGGWISPRVLFQGLYNLLTIQNTPPEFGNASEAASFYFLYPAVFFAVLISKELRARLGVAGWTLLAFLALMLFYMLVGLPASLARLTLLNYAYRPDVALGLASILLCLYVLSRMPLEAASLREGLAPWLAAGAAALLFTGHGLLMLKPSQGVIGLNTVLFVALLAGFVSYLMLSGKQQAFCALAGICVVATTALFNPLFQGIVHVYDSEMAQAIVKLNGEAADRPLWLCYGSNHSGTLASVVGCRSIAGVHFYPQLALWHALDLDRNYEWCYNRLADVALALAADDEKVSFANPAYDRLVVTVSPRNPALKALGARFVLATGETQEPLSRANLRLRYKSPQGHFTIFEIPLAPPTP